MTFQEWFNNTFTGSLADSAQMIGCKRGNIQHWKKGSSLPSLYWWHEIARAAAFVKSVEMKDMLFEMSKLEDVG